MSPSMHHIKYSSRGIMRIICGPVYTMNNIVLTLRTMHVIEINMGNARDSHSELVVLK